ncbi:MAG: HEAT repeat domain-containing protein [Armatimonadetes bacterium]|nr:HEAT repeat domain-containing protein [Armatimonadota bacterium]
MRKYLNYILFAGFVLLVVGMAVSHSRHIHGLVMAMSDGSAEERASAATALIKAEQFMDAITGETIQIRLKAAESLEVLAAPSAVKQLLPILKDQDKRVRERAVAALVKITSKSPDHIKELLPGLKDGDSNIKKGAVRAFKQIGPVLDAIPQIVAYLKKEPDSRVACGDVLGSPLFAKESKASLPLLFKLLDDKDEGVRVSVSEALGKIGDKEAIPLLNDKMHKDTAQVRRVCIGSIALIADASGESMLAEAVNNPDDDDESRSQAAVGLGKIGTPSAIDTLIKALNDPDIKLRTSTVGALSHAGRPTRDSAPVTMVLMRCVAALASKNVDTQTGAIQALQGISAPETNIPLLSVANNTQYPESLRIAAIRAVGFEGNTGVINALVALMATPNTEMLGNASDAALTVIGVQAIPALVAVFQKGDETTSFHAAVALGRMGAKALPALEQVAKGANTGVQRWAAVALGEMGIADTSPTLKQLAQSTDADVSYVAKEQLHRNGQSQ